MRKHFLKTIYFDHSKLGKKDNIHNSRANIYEKPDNTDEYIKNIEAFQNISEINFSQPITYFVGENGSGKSTLIEHIAQNFGFNKEGGTKNSLFHTNIGDKLNANQNWLQLSWQPQKFRSGFFLRGESIYNFINYQESIGGFNAYGGENLHTMSHGQQFIRILESLMGNVGFYIFDEIESALSPANQLKVVEIIKYMVSQGSQFIIATHSPIILSIFEESQILSFDYGYIHEIDYDMVPCVDMYRRILAKK